MSASELLAHLESRGVRFALSGGKVICTAPQGALTESMRAELRKARDSLAALLRDRRAGADAWEAAVAEVSLTWDGIRAQHGTSPCIDPDENSALLASVDRHIRACSYKSASIAIEAWRSAWLDLLRPARRRDVKELLDIALDPAASEESRRIVRDEVLARADAIIHASDAGVPPPDLIVNDVCRREAAHPPQSATTSPSDCQTPTDRNGAPARGREQHCTGAIVPQGDTEMKVSKFLSSYLKASDIAQPVTIIIDRVEEETVGQNGEAEQKLVLYPRGSSQGIVLSKTTISQLVDLLRSDDTDQWIGLRVVMFNDPSVQFQGRRVGGIRFRAYTPPKPLAEEVGEFPG